MAYYLLIDDEQVGPLEIEAIAPMIERGEVTRATMAWAAGMDDWAPATEISELEDLFDGPTPAPERDQIPADLSWPTTAASGPPNTAGDVNRPLDIGLAFRRTFESFGRQPVPAMLVGLIYSIVGTAVMMAMFGVETMFEPPNEQASTGTDQLQVSMIGLLAVMVVMPIVYGGLSIAMLNLVRGEPVRVSQLLAGLSRAPTLVGFWFLYAAGFILGLVFFVVPGFFVAVSFMLTPFIIVESRLDVFSSMKAGFRAVMGLGWWPCFLLLVALFIGTVFASAVVNVLAFAIPVPLFGVILTLAANSAVAVITVGTLAAAYEQARENQERANAAESESA